MLLFVPKKLGSWGLFPGSIPATAHCPATVQRLRKGRLTNFHSLVDSLGSGCDHPDGLSILSGAVDTWRAVNENGEIYGEG